MSMAFAWEGMYVCIVCVLGFDMVHFRGCCNLEWNIVTGKFVNDTYNQSMLTQIMTTWKERILEYDIGVLLLSKHIRRVGRFSLAGHFLQALGLLFPLGCDFGIRGGGISLLLIRDLLEPIELFSVELVELGVDI
jgi:hypothetical protein